MSVYDYDIHACMCWCGCEDDVRQEEQLCHSCRMPGFCDFKIKSCPQPSPQPSPKTSPQPSPKTSPQPSPKTSPQPSPKTFSISATEILSGVLRHTNSQCYEDGGYATDC